MSVTAVPIAPTRRGILIALWLGIAAAVALGAWVAFAGTAQVVAERGDNAQFLAFNAKRAGVVETPSGLQYQILTPGDGKAHPTDADVTLVNYEGKLRDGATFDKSERPTPMPVAAVVPGFSEGLKALTKGAKARFWIKPELGYKDEEKRDQTGKVVIPANSVLVFDVELVDFLPEAVIRQMQMQQMQQQGGMPGGAPGGAVPPQGAPQP